MKLNLSTDLIYLCRRKGLTDQKTEIAAPLVFLFSSFNIFLCMMCRNLYLELVYIIVRVAILLADMSKCIYSLLMIVFVFSFF